jgi:hypothetical protein
LGAGKRIRGQAGEGGLSVHQYSKVLGDGDSILAEIVRRIEGQALPQDGRKMGSKAGPQSVQAEGEREDREGELLETSGSEILDQASLETVQRAAPALQEGWLKVCHS